MKTKLFLLPILPFFIGISISLAQGNENGRTAYDDPLPGDPPPYHPPGCIPPPVPVLFQVTPNFISWTGVSGAIGYHIWYGPPGASYLNPKVIYNSANGVTFSVYYDDLPYGTYTFYIQSFSSGCSSAFSAPFTVTVTNPSPPEQIIDPGNDPYGYDLPELPDDTGGGGEERTSLQSALHGVLHGKSINKERKFLDEHGAGIYPNPVSNVLHVSLPFDLSLDTKFLVTDMNGRSINLPVSTSHGNTQIETSGISPGIYLLSVISGQRSFKQKFIKN